MQEIWKDIKGYEGLYQVSNLGRVRSLDRCVNSGYGSKRLVKGNVLKPNYKQGYATVGLSINQKRKWVKIARLVGIEFIPNSNNYPCVNHIDEDRGNDRVDNLEWCTHQYNNTYSNRLIGWAHKVSRKLSKPVEQYTMDGVFVKRWDSMIQAEREGGYLQGVISNCCSGRTKSHAGFLWRFEGDVI